MRSTPNLVQICKIYTREFLFLAHQVDSSFLYKWSTIGIKITEVYTERNFKPFREGLLHARCAQMLWKFTKIFNYNFLHEGLFESWCCRSIKCSSNRKLQEYALFSKFSTSTFIDLGRRCHKNIESIAFFNDPYFFTPSFRGVIVFLKKPLKMKTWLFNSRIT
jgi:hypothetical protein